MREMTAEEEWERIKRMKREEVQAELNAAGVSCKSAVSHVLQLVREAKRRQEKYRAEMN